MSAATDLKREYQEFLQEHNRNRSDSDGRPDRDGEEIFDCEVAPGRVDSHTPEPVNLLQVVAKCLRTFWLQMKATP